MDQALVVQYLRRWQVARASALADEVQGYSGPQLPEKTLLALVTEKPHMPFSPVLAENRAMIRLLLGESPDLKERPLHLGREKLPGTIFYLDEMAERTQVMTILESLVVQLRTESIPSAGADLCQSLLEQAIPSAGIKRVFTMGDALNAILGGDTLLLVEGLPAAMQLATDGPTARKPEEPAGEPAVRGPKDGFTETAGVNLSLIRRRLRDDRLRVEPYTLGSRTHTRVYLLYLLGITFPGLVEEVRQRIGRIQIDAVLESGYIEELIEDQPFTIFPQVKPTERPDVAVAAMLEGKVALITDGTPHVLLMPATFAAEMQAAEDYYQRWPIASFIRFLRYGYLSVGALGPAVYIAITTYHHELLPTNLLFSLIAAREGVPFPAVIEALFMELTMEALREAGVRLPKVVGQAISIVGALVIGDAAVRAGLVSPVMVIVVSLTAISSFIIPLYSMSLAIRLLRFGMILFAGFFGFFGLVVGGMLLFLHLSGLRSFGIPYLSPLVPPTAGDLRDAAIRLPWWALRRRPKFMPAGDHRRGDSSNRPRAPKAGQGGGPDADSN